MIMLKNPRERSRLIRYSLVGSLGAVVDFAVFNFLVSVLAVVPLVSSIFSFIAAVISNFTWNRHWTFPDSRSKSFSRQLGEFAVVSSIGLAIRTPIFALLVPAYERLFAILSIPIPLSSEALGRNLALVSVIGVVMLWNFFINRFWTFGDID